MQKRGQLAGALVFCVLIASRKALFNTNGPATGALLFATIAAAFAGGLLFKGKSGWCSSICPLLPLQRLYGQTPFVPSPNGHCAPCVACTKNCYDFNPLAAYQADLHDVDADWSMPRKVFAGIFPGVVVAYFTLPNPPAISVGRLYLEFALYAAVTIAGFFFLDAFFDGPPTMLAALYGAAAISLFYWFGARPTMHAVTTLTGADAAVAVWPLRAVVIALAVLWLVRTAAVGRRFVVEAASGPGVQTVRIAPRDRKTLEERAVTGHADVRVEPDGRSLVAPIGACLLDVVAEGGLPVEAGCRMGLCGSDPVAVLDGAEHLSAVEEDEAATLRRLGLAASTRMACCARVEGDVVISLRPEPAEERGGVEQPPELPIDPAIRSVVVIGNGIAGVTAADFVRRNHSDCDIHLIGDEPHHLYNRMGISRLVHDRSGMKGMYLLPEVWYDEHRVTTWINTKVTRIHPEFGEIELGDRKRIPFDRAIVATGSRSFLPPIEGMERRGCFVLRNAADAIAIRAHAQEFGGRAAIVAGAGLLGLEAAYALRQAGYDVCVLERADRLLSRFVDETCSQLLTSYFDAQRIHVRPRSELIRTVGGASVERVELSDGSVLPAEIVLVCAGIQPNVELAEAAGIAVERGVLVDDHMRTSAPRIFACGDVAQFRNSVPGLWPTAVSQAEVAALNALGGDRRHHGGPLPVILKGTGIDLVASGRIDPDPGDRLITHRGDGFAYGRVVVAAGHIVGGLLLDQPEHSKRLLDAVTRQRDVGTVIDRLEVGDWGALDPVPASS